MNKKAFFGVVCAVCVVLCVFFRYLLIGYRFLGLLFFVLAAFFAFLAFCDGTRRRGVVILRRVVSVLAVFGIVSCFAMTFYMSLESGGDADAECDYLIILGAGINGRSPSLTLADRLSRAEEYLNKYENCVAIVSGSRASDEITSEASVMAAFLKSRGIDGSRIIKEEQADNTAENMQYSLALCRPGARIAVLSSDYHIFRSRRCARREGIEPVMISAKTSLPVLHINYSLRETFAYIKFLIRR